MINKRLINLIHLKVKASNKHNLLTSKDLLSGQQDDLIKENMASNFCQKHLMRFISFCEDCDSLVCELCQTTKHHLHLLTPINLHSAKESFTVRAYLPLVNKSINNFQLRISNLKKQHKNLVYFRKTFHKEFAERILKVIDRITFKLQSYADILHIVVDNLLDDHIEKLKKHDIEKLKDQLELAKITYSFANNLLEYDFPTCTIPLSNTVQKQLSLFKKPPKTKTPKLRAFSLNAQEKLSIELIEEMIGEIQLDGKDKNDTSLINFSCKLKNDKFPCVISDLSIDHDNSKLVVVDEANKNLKSFNFDGSFDCYSQDSYFKNPIRVVVLRNNHDYLINDENTIKRSDKSFKNLNLFSKHKFRQPVGICQSSNGEILVCEWLSGQVLGFDEIGTLVRTFPCHSRNPAYISCCFTCDHIIISDWKTHSVKLFHWNGNLINSYGESKDNTLEHNEKQLSLNHPHGVCSDAEDNILVCDSWNNRIKILDWKGRYKNTLLDLKNGLKCPQAIDVTYNHCFIAERHGFIKVFEYFLNKDV